MNLKKLLQKFNEPFPEEGNFRDNVMKSFWVGLFIAAFLFFFRPFGVGSAGADLFWVCAVFGLITALTTISFTTLTRFVLNLQRDTDSWTLGKWLIDTTILILCIAVVNYLFMLYLSATRFEFEAFIGVVFNTFIIGIFPVVISGLLIQINSARKFSQQAAVLHRPISSADKAQHKLLKFPGNNVSTITEVFTDELLYVESKSNYVMIAKSQQGKVRLEKVRGTIQSIEEMVGEYPIVRCHRSFLVNLEAVKQVSGNAQGLRLQLVTDGVMEIPVSRSYVAAIRGHLSKEVD